MVRPIQQELKAPRRKSPVQLDRLGRVLVPGFLREYAELRDAAVIVGLNNRIEIWSSTNWHAERSIAEQDSVQLAEHLFSLGL